MKLFFLLLLVFIGGQLFGQDYFVLQVKGTVKRTKTGAVLKTKDVIKAEDQLTFASPNDAVAVVNSKSGRFIIKPGKPNKTNELLAYVQDALSQASSRLSTRSGGFNNMLDFQTYFKDQVLLLPELCYAVNNTGFPINENAFFYIEYTYKGERIPKQLKVNNENLLIINREELFKIDGQPITINGATDFKLIYFSNGNVMELTGLNFNTIDPLIIKTEVLTLIDVMKAGNKQDAMINESIAYINESYGKVDEPNLKRWLDLK